MYVVVMPCLCVCVRLRAASTGLPGRVQLSKSTFDCLSPEKQMACELRRGVAMKGKGLIDTHLASFDPDGQGLSMWRNFCRFEKMTKVRRLTGTHQGFHAMCIYEKFMYVLMRANEHMACELISSRH